MVTLAVISIHAGANYAAPNAQMGASELLPNGPKYPDALIKRGAEAEATVMADIGTNGRTVNCPVVASSAPEAGKSGLEYCHGARYKPATLNGYPAVQHEKMYYFKFKLD